MLSATLKELLEDDSTTSTSWSPTAGGTTVPRTGDALLPSLPPYYSRHLTTPRAFSARHELPGLVEESLHDLMESLEARLGKSKRGSTWSNISSIVHQFLRWDKRQLCPKYQIQRLDYKMALWVVAKVEAGHLKGSSPLEYTKKCAAVFKEATGGSSETLAVLSAAWRKDPNFCAAPGSFLTLESIMKVFRSSLPARTRMQILLQWKTASRTSDMAHLTNKSFQSSARDPDGSYMILVNWPMGVKGSQLPHTDLIRMEPLESKLLWELVRDTPDGTSVFSATATTITQALRNTLNTDTTSHAIKRGALRHLLELGFTPQQVAFKAKHQDVRLLRVYVGPEAWARAFKAPEMARVI